MYKPISNKWVKIFYTRKNGSPYFMLNKRRVHLDHLIRCQYNPWDSSIHYPSYIHGYTTDGIFVQLSNDNEYVKLYEYIKD